MDAGHLLEPEWAHCGDADWAGGTIMNCGYRARLQASATDVWQSVSRIGGKTGWYFGNFLWRLRGIMDRLVGGVGLRRGRRHPSEIGVGDALDFWRVLEVEAPRRLLLVAEMKTPGDALLEFQITPARQRSGRIADALAVFAQRDLWHSLLVWALSIPSVDFFRHAQSDCQSQSTNPLYTVLNDLHPNFIPLVPYRRPALNECAAR